MFRVKLELEQSTRLRLLIFVMGLALGGLSLRGAPGPVAHGAEPPPGAARATFAGGCFWCMEAPFDKVSGVISTTSGYAGGTVENPSYRQVSAGVTGHAEVVQVEFETEWEYWNDLQREDRAGYDAEKERVAAEVLARR